MYLCKLPLVAIYVFTIHIQLAVDEDIFITLLESPLSHGPLNPDSRSGSNPGLTQMCVHTAIIAWCQYVGNPVEKMAFNEALLLFIFFWVRWRRLCLARARIRRIPAAQSIELAVGSTVALDVSRCYFGGTLSTSPHTRESKHLHWFFSKGLQTGPQLCRLSLGVTYAYSDSTVPSVGFPYDGHRHVPCIWHHQTRESTWSFKHGWM